MNSHAENKKKAKPTSSVERYCPSDSDQREAWTLEQTTSAV